MTNGDVDGAKPQIKIAYIEITENVLADGGKKEEEEAMVPQQQPRLPPKRSVIPQAKNVPIPTSRPPKPEPLEPSNDMKSWVRAEMRSLATNNPGIQDVRKNTSLACDVDAPNVRNFKSKSTLALNEPTPRSQIEPETKPRTSLSPKKSSVDDHNDLLTVLTTKSRSRSAIHVVEDSSSYGKLKSQMSLEDILAVNSANSSSSSILTQAPKLLPRSQSISCDSNGRNGLVGPPFCAVRNGAVDSWTAEDKISPTKIPSLRSKQPQELHEALEGPKSPTTSCSKIPTSRNLGRRSASVTDMKKVFEKPEASSSGTSSPGSQSISGSTATHNRFPSLDSSLEDSIRPEVDQERFSGEQFGSISSLASSTSLISQQELAQLVEEANLEEPRGGHDVVVVLLHKENPSGSVGITLAGGLDCETKEITIHRVLAHSIADRDGSVQRGDRILSINGRSMRGLTHRESLAVLKQPRSEVVLVVSRAKLDDAAAGNRLRNRTESVETIVEGHETNGVTENTAWGPALMVSMYKDGAGLGFSLEGGRDSPLGDRPLLIKKIFTGGAAEKTGALRAGDQLLEVNKRDVSRMSRIEAWSLMKKLPDGEVNLLVRHPATKSS
ncbi:hypothetical protein TSAR_012533 [Trichomalopsis sarcophagae]|uniref:Pro-interleukin-16 n=1 Tax=Trichomalopsis sarcophagae TaxID=543379 RepID=A0A232EWA3_9HYME|nr:hypothetical protein TSAR_012533 [Trichomalopsis sarcophagae]